MPPSPCTVISPAVRLSPNATNLDRLSCGGAVTVTMNVHSPITFFVSIAVHVTGVVPIWNVVSLAGMHDNCTGGVPPAAVGVP